MARDQSQEELENNFIQAVQDGDIQNARSYLEQGVDVNVDRNETLSIAVRKGDLQMVKLLMDYGADPHDSYEGYHSPLKLAISHNRTQILKFFIKDGVDIYSRKDSLLKLATRYANQFTLEFLKKHIRIMSKNFSLKKDYLVGEKNE